MRTLFFLAACLLCARAAAASGAVHGVVRNELLEPIAGATVTLRGDKGHPVQTATAAPDGSYSFPGIAAGRYTIEAQAPKHLPDRKAVEVGDADAEVDLYCLEPAAVQTVVTERKHVCDEPVTKPLPIDRPSEIEYTKAARSDGVEGRMVLRVEVARNGSVAHVAVVKSVDPSLDAAAVASVRTWRFRPALRCGQPVAGGVYTLARRFELGD